MNEKWQDLPLGGVILEGGNAEKFETGDWSTEKPILNKEKCINCFLCWIYCPDSSIIIKNGKVSGIDYAHCKGCGICVNECPAKVKALELKKEI